MNCILQEAVWYESRLSSSYKCARCRNSWILMIITIFRLWVESVMQISPVLLTAEKESWLVLNCGFKFSLNFPRFLWIYFSSLCLAEFKMKLTQTPCFKICCWSLCLMLLWVIFQEPPAVYRGTMIEIWLKFYGNILRTFLTTFILSYSPLILPKPISLWHERHVFFVAYTFFCNRQLWVDVAFHVFSFTPVS